MYIYIHGYVHTLSSGISTLSASLSRCCRHCSGSLFQPFPFCTNVDAALYRAFLLPGTFHILFYCSLESVLSGAGLILFSTFAPGGLDSHNQFLTHLCSCIGCFCALVSSLDKLLQALSPILISFSHISVVALAAPVL